MLVQMYLLNMAAFLTFVTADKCDNSMDPKFWTSSTNELLRGPNIPVTRFYNENNNLSPSRNFENINKFWTNLENVDKEKMGHYIKNYDDLNVTFLPHNYLKCPPCLCKNISSYFVSVICKSCPFTTIPKIRSFEIKELIIYNTTRFKVLDLSTLSIYTSLTQVKAIVNDLVKVHSSSHLNVSSNIIELDLTSNAITTIENNSFLLFNQLQVLSLRWNDLGNLTKQMFTGLSSLYYLSVSFNAISFIANDTFDDLRNLAILDISGNEMVYFGQPLLPVRIFMALSNLQHLFIDDLCAAMSQHCSTFTNEALQDLKNLKLLRIDGDDRRGLGPEVKSLEKLRTLIITTKKEYNLTNESYFDNVPLINTLVFTGLFSHNVHLKAFTKLKNLVNFTYSLSNGRTNLCHILSDIQYLLNSPLKYLTLAEVSDRYCGCKTLKDEDAKYLTLFELFELDLSSNHLLYLSSGFLAMLPASIKKFDLSGNSIAGNLFLKFSVFPKALIELNLNNQYYDYYDCNDGEKVSQQNVAGENLNNRTSLISIESDFKKSLKNQQEINYKKREDNIKKTAFFDNLRILRGNNFRDFGEYVQSIYFSLIELSLAGGENTMWALSNLSSTIEIADFSDNYADAINPYFFPKNSSLKYLEKIKQFIW